MGGNATNRVTVTMADTTTVRSIPQPSFWSQEQYAVRRVPYKFSKDRGTAFGAIIEREYYQDLIPNATAVPDGGIMIGISHVKSFRRLPHIELFSYLSRLYAVAIDDPFTVVAKSGLFCLDWHDDDWKDAKGTNMYFRIRRTIYDCPAIHFPTGITVSATDPSKIIMGYGILDRQPRFVEYSKRELSLHLFSPLPNNERTESM